MKIDLICPYSFLLLHPTIMVVNQVKYVGNNQRYEEEILPGPTHQQNVITFVKFNQKSYST